MKKRCGAGGFYALISFAAAAMVSGLLLSLNNAAGGERIFENSLGMKLVLIPAGEFVMGSPFDEKYRQQDEFPHPVVISRPYYIGMTEVTQAQWVEIMGINRSNSRGDNLPVEKISWQDAVLFCKKLSEREGKIYRLPTEAEWEYACRAGIPGAVGADGMLYDVAWYASNSDAGTHAIGSKTPNAWGLYDMLGNVSEWCGDYYVPDYPRIETVDPAGPEKGSARVIRGGAWDSFPPACRAAARSSAPSSYQFTQTGLRVVMEAE